MKKKRKMTDRKGRENGHLGYLRLREREKKKKWGEMMTKTTACTQRTQCKIGQEKTKRWPLVS